MSIGARRLRDVIAAPFRAAVNEAGLAGVMSAYHEIDGLPCTASPEIMTSVLRARAGAGGVVLVPHLDGERTPNRPDATGTLHGLRTSTTRADIARAAYEGVVCSLLDALDAAGVATAGRVSVVGGGARSPLYAQLLADLSGREVSVPAPATERVAVGAAVQVAAVACGESVDAVARRWAGARPAGRCVTPTIEPGQAQEVRAAYAAARG